MSGQIPFRALLEHWGSQILSLNPVTEILLHFVFSHPLFPFLSSLLVSDEFPASFPKVLSLSPYFLSFLFDTPRFLTAIVSWFSTFSLTGERVSRRCTAAECPGEQAAAEGQTPAWSQHTAPFSVWGQNFPANFVNWEGGNWLLQLNQELKKKKKIKKESKNHYGIYLGILK